MNDNDIGLIEKNETDCSDERKLAMGLFGLPDEEDKENGDEIHKREEAE